MYLLKPRLNLKFMNIFPIKNCIAKILTATSVASVLLTGMSQGQAKAACLAGSCVAYTDSNNEVWDITTLTGTFNALQTQLTDTTHNFWWGNNPKAQSVATAVAGGLGLPNGGLFVSPYYISSLSSNAVGATWYNFGFGGGLGSATINPNSVAVFAYATKESTNNASVPEPEEWAGTILAAGLVVVARRKLSLAQKIDSKPNGRN
jgi:hypothetical protein